MRCRCSLLVAKGRVISVRFESDAIQKRYLAPAIDPQRVVPPTGPESPQLEVHWKLTPPHDEFRIDYADPNVDFHCGGIKTTTTTTSAQRTSSIRRLRWKLPRTKEPRSKQRLPRNSSGSAVTTSSPTSFPTTRQKCSTGIVDSTALCREILQRPAAKTA